MSFNTTPFGAVQARPAVTGKLEIYNLEGEAAPASGTYDAAGRISFTRADGSVYTPDRIDTILYHPTTAADTVLAALATAVAAAADADVGALSSAFTVPANFHGLPTNFGPGAGNWSVADAARLRVSVLHGSTHAALTTEALFQCAAIESGGDVSVLLHSIGASAILGDVWIQVSLAHSIQG